MDDHLSLSNRTNMTIQCVEYWQQTRKLTRMEDPSRSVVCQQRDVREPITLIQWTRRFWFGENRVPVCTGYSHLLVWVSTMLLAKGEKYRLYRRERNTNSPISGGTSIGSKGVGGCLSSLPLPTRREIIYIYWDNLKIYTIACSASSSRACASSKDACCSAKEFFKSSGGKSEMQKSIRDLRIRLSRCKQYKSLKCSGICTPYLGNKIGHTGPMIHEFQHFWFLFLHPRRISTSLF